MITKKQIRTIVAQIESLLNAEIPGTPRIMGKSRGRVLYVPMPGSKAKARNVLSRRGQQVYAMLMRQKRATAADLQEALSVNRNVIAGAMHELRQAHLVKVERVSADE